MSILNFLKDQHNLVTLQTLQLLIMSIAIVVGGIWTYILFVRKRQKYPRANITHRVEHWPVSDGKTLLRVTVNISNEGEILLSLVSGFTRVQQMMPWPPELLEFIKRDKEFVKGGQTEVEWPLLKQRPFPFEKREREIEPGEIDEVHFDFIIDPEVQIVVLYSYLKNKRKWRREIGWNTTSVYELRSGS